MLAAQARTGTSGAYIENNVKVAHIVALRAQNLEKNFFSDFRIKFRLKDVRVNASGQQEASVAPLNRLSAARKRKEGKRIKIIRRNCTQNNERTEAR